MIFWCWVLFCCVFKIFIYLIFIFLSNEFNDFCGYSTWLLTALRAHEGPVWIPLLTPSNVNLEIKLSVILLAKMGLFGILENYSLGQATYRKYHRLVQQAKERNVILWRRRKLGRVVLNKSPIEKSMRSRWWQFLIGWVAWGSWLLVGDAMYISSCWGL